ncbi:MAG: DUF3050 domain-containing protein [Candidatus Obscuribacterales bacterium]
MQSLSDVQREIAPLRAALVNHQVYRCIRSIEDLQTFMQYHVFAVWDFMSLLKALQARLTTVTTPWVPSPQGARFARLINEIVLGEESDLLDDGTCVSHFEMYLAAMKQCGADVRQIQQVVSEVGQGKKLTEALHAADSPLAVSHFVGTTFGFIDSNQSHVIAAAFTLGREDLIPDMFTGLVESLDSNLTGERTRIFIDYLQRHIDVDGGTHGPLAHELLSALCESDRAKWQDVYATAQTALIARRKLWDVAQAQITAAHRAAQPKSSFAPALR